jgi:hypothetical protein
MITNYLSPVEFIVSVERLPHVQFFTQSVTIPSLSLAPIDKPSPFKPIPVPGDRVSYSELPLSFIIDEQMSNFIEVFNWIKGLGFPETFDQYRNLKNSEAGLLTDISIVIMNSHKNPNIEIQFKDCFPTGLSDVVLDTTQTDIIYPQATVSFAFLNYSIRQIS